MKKITAAIAAVIMLAAIPAAAHGAGAKETKPAPSEAKAETVSAIGSVSKVFCTTAALQLADKGLIDIDAPVTYYVPDFTMQDERYKDITVRMLMNHTSGLQGMVYDDMMLYGESDMSYHDRFLEHLSGTRLKWQPGTMSSYCNDGFTLLEIVVERVSGESFTDYVQNHIAMPLALENTGTSYKLLGHPKTAKLFYDGASLETDYCTAFGSGGLMSTAPELSKFGTAFFTGNDILLSQKVKDEMQVNYARSRYDSVFGLGWDTVETMEDYDFCKDVNLMFKGGALFHQFAGLLVAPDEQISVAVTMNGGSSMEVTTLAHSLMFDALNEKGITVTAAEPALMDTLDSVPEKYLHMADIYARVDGFYKVDFPEGRHMEITELTADNPRPKRYLCTTEDCFVLMEGDPGSDKFVQKADGELLTFTERDGETCICKKENYYADGFGRYIESSYFLQRVGGFDVSPEVQDAWQKRSGKRYYVTNMKYSNAYYNTQACGQIEIPEGTEGCVFMKGLNKTVRMTDENSADFFVHIGGAAGRDPDDFEVITENGCEYLRTKDKSLWAVSEDDILEFTADIHEIALENKNAKWYNIGEMGGKTITLDIPENACVYVYDKFDRPLYNSFLKNLGDEITLPEEGKIMFAGEDGAKVVID